MGSPICPGPWPQRLTLAPETNRGPGEMQHQPSSLDSVEGEALPFDTIPIRCTFYTFLEKIKEMRIFL